eukprot:5388701-Prymnesium_polylepis.3
MRERLTELTLRARSGGAPGPLPRTREARFPAPHATSAATRERPEHAPPAAAQGATLIAAARRSAHAAAVNYCKRGNGNGDDATSRKRRLAPR